MKFKDNKRWGKKSKICSNKSDWKGEGYNFVFGFISSNIKQLYTELLMIMMMKVLVFFGWYFVGDNFGFEYIQNMNRKLLENCWNWKDCVINSFAL